MKISFFVLNLFNAIALIYAESKILQAPVNFKSKKIYIVLIILSLCCFLTNTIDKSVLRVIVIFQIYNACHIYLFRSEKDNIQRITFTSIISWIVLVLSEVAVALGVTIFSKMLGKDINYFEEILGYLVLIIFSGVISIRSVNKFLIKTTDMFTRFKSYNILFGIMYIFVILLTMLYLIYFNLSQTTKFILLILAFIEYLYLLLFVLFSYRNREKLQKELDLLLEVTSKYERVINDIRTKNHESKNQLVVIKGLVKDDNKKAISYIDSMLETKYSDEEELIFKVANIPNGGLKGLVYYKILTMQSKKIDFHLEVNKKVKKNILDNIDIKSLQDFYKIIGVFLDNAIEEVEQNEQKIILIEIYTEDDYLYFVVSNEYKNSIDFDKIGKFIITTKGKNHGYGLKLVNELVESNDNLIHRTEIVGNLFVQKIGIKIKG